LPHLLDWLAAEAPDVVCLQETKTVDEAFPLAEIEAAGYQAVFSGQKTYNGVAILSRQPARDVVMGIPGFADAQKRVLAATVAGVRVICLYVPNGQSLDSDKYPYKLAWLAALENWVRELIARESALVVLGDFNIAPEDRDVHDPAAWVGSVHVSPEERAVLARMLGSGLSDVFRRFSQPEKAFSWWDYRAAAFRRNHGLRIDLILANTALAGRCLACHIDREPRTAERPSDHTPVIAEFNKQ
jgi:exodeoxyribonuclease-3